MIAPRMPHCRQTWKSALRAHCPAQAPNILAAGQAELAGVEIRYDWIHRRAYRADVRPSRDVYPSILRLYQRGGLGTTIRPQGHTRNCAGACHAVSSRGRPFPTFIVAIFGCNNHDQIEAIHCSSSE